MPLSGYFLYYCVILYTIIVSIFTKVVKTNRLRKRKQYKFDIGKPVKHHGGALNFLLYPMPDILKMIEDVVYSRVMTLGGGMIMSCLRLLEALAMPRSAVEIASSVIIVSLLLYSSFLMDLFDISCEC